MATQYPVLNNKPIDQWNVTELKEELQRRKISVRGLKEELVRKLHETIQNEMDMMNDTEMGGSSNPNSYEENGNQVKKELVVEDRPDIADTEMGNSSNPNSYKENGNQVKKELVVEDRPDIADRIEKSENDNSVVDINDNVDANQGIKEQGVDTAPFVGFNTTTDEPIAYAVSMEDSPTGSQTVTMHGDSYGHNVRTDVKHKELKHPVEDVKLSLSEPDNQVPLASPDLGSQVKSEFIPTDSVLINEKNKLKDNINADNFHLELEFVKSEMLHPSSSAVPTIRGDLHPQEDDKEPVKILVSLEGIDGKNATILDLVKKEDSVDMGSPEKLNLDRSSGDESIEEDLLESKHVETKHNPKSEDLGEQIEESKAHAVNKRADIDMVVDESVPGKTDTIKEDKLKPTAPAEKRKIEDHEAVGGNETLKRQRHWKLETVKIPEQKTANLISSSTPNKDAFQTIPRHTYTKSDSKLNGNSMRDCIEPPSQKPATTSLRIDKFLRPFTLKRVQELLAKTGSVCSFWMDHIKTHCYVTYSSVEEATLTRNAVYNLQWPPNGGNHLVAEFVDPQEVKMRVEAPPQAPAPITPIPTTPKAHLQQPQPGQPPACQHALHKQLPPPLPLLSNPPSARDRLRPPKEPEPPVLTHNDLFKKTRATPRVYYLPLSEEEVRVKLTAQGKSIRD